MVSTKDFKNGMAIIMDGQIHLILWFQHHKPGKGGAVMRTKLKNLATGSIVDKTFRAGTKFEAAHLIKKRMEYLYREGASLVFMDNETYEQVTLNTSQIGEGIRFLKENTPVELLTHKGRILEVELPITVSLKVTHTEPGLKGDRATSGAKPATIETGAIVRVPLFINTGDIVKIDTRTGEYLERA
ncbi:MAG TPA: elongation factor P [bacterium]|nr:elongation factor P [bacterium]